jgi:hypothetical protein
MEYYCARYESVDLPPRAQSGTASGAQSIALPIGGLHRVAEQCSALRGQRRDTPRSRQHHDFGLQEAESD